MKVIILIYPILCSMLWFVVEVSLYLALWSAENFLTWWLKQIELFITQIVAVNRASLSTRNDQSLQHNIASHSYNCPLKYYSYAFWSYTILPNSKVFFIYCALHVSLILASNVRLTFVHDNSKALFFTGNKVHNGRTRSFRGNNRIEIGCITFKPLKK